MHRPLPVSTAHARDDDTAALDLWSLLAEAGLPVRLSMEPVLDHFELRTRTSR